MATSSTRRGGETRDRRKKRGGLILIELIVVATLLVGFTIILTSLFMVTLKANTAANRRSALISRIDSAVGTLRRDVWGARAMSYADGHLDLQLGADNNVRWETNEPHRLTRKQTGAVDSTQTWLDLPSVDAVDVHGPLVTLEFQTGTDQSTGAKREFVTMVSELMVGGVK